MRIGKPVILKSLILKKVLHRVDILSWSASVIGRGGPPATSIVIVIKRGVTQINVLGQQFTIAANNASSAGSAAINVGQAFRDWFALNESDLFSGLPPLAKAEWDDAIHIFSRIAVYFRSLPGVTGVNDGGGS